MKNYRKKPVVIQAEQWFQIGDAEEAQIEAWGVREADKCDKCGHPLETHGKCPTLEGHHIVCPGDFIIKGVQGEFYPCKPDIFEV